MNKQLLRHILACATACTIICSNSLPLVRDLIPSPAVTAKAASCCSFDETTGVLTLSGYLDKATVHEYWNYGSYPNKVRKKKSRQSALSTDSTSVMS